MSVIINEFEIIPEQQGQETAVSPPTPPAPPAPPITPTDIVDVLRRQSDRFNRIHAH